ncbi:hypothetical protein CAPTEDRAFT_196595 [Capitella teleta]|uniref:Uncharacterized protein n=1 Tax=Capitella teleta TaxID=283909 RepID=R7U791_CAPTE|nr:hypothetical protein CAPTEDRAFT_196595 [Capitella teleta]|eukprot:ELU01839.1 hypothetical protein CAPTEDRAFT_196595 [Capitella teleta]
MRCQCMQTPNVPGLMLRQTLYTRTKLPLKKNCRKLSEEGKPITPTSQPAVQKALIRQANEVFFLQSKLLAPFKQFFFYNAAERGNESHTTKTYMVLHGKQLKDREYQAVVLKNSDSEIKLDLDDGKAETITESNSSVIDECNPWGSIKMIISDTTSVDTGNKAGVGVRQQKIFAIRDYQKTQFIGCQPNVLDRILRCVMDKELGSNTKSPNIDYFFVHELLSTYESL